MNRTFSANHYSTGEPVQVHFEDGRITGVEATSSADDLPYVAPGLFDIQINGYSGIWFSSPKLSTADVEQVTQSMLAHGVAGYFPTLVTNSFDALKHGFETIRQACETSDVVRACVRGCHLEGPYISAEDGPRGAHPLQHVRDADIDEFDALQAASGNRIRLVTLAAETGNAVPFIRHLVNSGVVVALGHTAATSVQIAAAVDAGAKLSTHFGNGAHGVLPRHPNYLWEQLADERLWASVIADGFHVPASVLNCVRLCKTTAHTILTCDVSGFAGCPPGTYAEGDVAVEVLDDGRLVVAGQRQYLAGSGATTGDCIVGMMAACSIPLGTAIDMATANPSRLMGEPVGEITPGAEATLTVFRLIESSVGGSSVPGRAATHFDTITTIVKGDLLFGNLP
ncbi:MAG: amidohydrolase family protein [Planctomycetaceae bacterium]